MRSTFRTARSVSLLADSLDFLGDAANYGVSLLVLGMALRWRARAALLKAACMAAFGFWVLFMTVQHALAGTDPVCEMALAIFCSVLGATAGNLALMVLATGGVFVAGGIAPRILPYLQKGGFREAFDRKGRLHTMVERFPAYVVTHPQPGLLGAAAIAAGSSAF